MRGGVVIGDGDAVEPFSAAAAMISGMESLPSEVVEWM
jgi:hypothetical protein